MGKVNLYIVEYQKQGENRLCFCRVVAPSGSAVPDIMIRNKVIADDDYLISANLLEADCYI